MTIMQQVIHVFAKDVRAHLSEIGSVVLLNVVLVVTSSQTWSERMETSESGALGTILVTIRGFGVLLLVLAWCLLIARVVLAEGPANRNGFWLTRPYSRAALLIEKALFVFVFVHLLLVVSQILILVLSGLPFTVRDVLLNQLMLFVLISLPAATIASVSRSLAHFIVASLALGGLMLMLFLGQSVLRDLRAVSGADWESYLLSGFWVLIIMAAAIIAVVCLAGLVWQYRSRQTLRVAAFSLAGYFVLALTLTNLPATVISSANAALQGSPPRSHSMRFEPNAGVLRYAPSTGVRDAMVVLPLRAGQRMAEEPWFLNVELQISDRAGAGYVFHGILGYSDDTLAHAQFRIAEPVFSRLKDEPVVARIVYDLQAFERVAVDSIPTDGSYTIVDGSSQCGVGPYDYLVCRSAYLDASSWLSDNLFGLFRRSASFVRRRPSIPLAINPVFSGESRVQVPASGARLDVVIREPSGYARYAVDLGEIRLDDWNAWGRR